MRRPATGAAIACVLALALGACMPTPQQQAELARVSAARDAEAATANTDR